METDISSSFTITEIIQIFLAVLTAGGVIVAALGIFISSSSAKKRATIDVIMQHSSDDSLQEAITCVNRMDKNNESASQYFIDDSCEEKAHILKVLNAREFVCIGIKCGAFSEKMYKTSSCSVFIRDWDNLSSIVAEIRRETKKDTYFIEFEKIVKKWKKKPIKS